MKGNKKHENAVRKIKQRKIKQRKKEFNKIRLGKMLICAIGLIFLGNISVSAISDTTVNFHFFSKKAAVHIENFTMEKGRRVPWEKEGIGVLPGECVSIIPVIYNDGIDCYVRAKVTITSEQQPSIPITIEDIAGMNEKWIQIGEYFYYKDMLLEDKKISFFEEICIPKDWDGAIDSGNQWEIQVQADVVSADKLTPDFQADDPWGQQNEKYEILDSGEAEVLEAIEIHENFIFEIESELEEFEIGTEEKVQNLAGFIPGEGKECEITIRNLDEKERIIYIRAEEPSKLRLLSQMEISITWTSEETETILYQGVISGIQEVLARIRLVVPGNSEGKLAVRLELPKETDNTYAAKEGNFCLVLMNEMNQSDLDNTQDDFGHIMGDVDTTEDSSTQTEDVEKLLEHDSFSQGNSAVQTGDSSTMGIWIFLMSMAMGIFLLYLGKQKR